jgi:GGDEF domain-containing protein
MFSPKKPPFDPSKIKLPKAAVAPGLAELQAMHEQATENRPREVELIWTEPDSTKSFSMSVRFEPGTHDPTWTLWEDDGQEGRLVWKFETSDFELVNDVVCMLKKSKPAETPAFGKPNEPQAPRDPFEAMKPKPTVQPLDPFGALTPNAGGGGFKPVNPTEQQNPYQSNTRMPEQQNPSSYQPGYFTKADPKQQQPAPQPQQPLMRNPYLDSAADADVGATGLPMPRPKAPELRKENEGVYAAPEKKADTIEGNLSEMPVPALLRSLVTNQATGKLEIIGEETVGDVFFENGMPKHSGTPTEYGDGAIRELVTWEKGTYVFTPNSRTEMRSVTDPLEKIITDGIQLLDQKRHLKRAGLAYESYLCRLHKNLSDTELKLLLTKGAPLDFEFQRDIYNYLRHKRTFTDLLRDKPMDSSMWSALLFNFLSCGLIEIKQPDSFKGSSLDFLGEARAQVQAIHESFIRPETGVYSYPALMYFMEYELHRYEAYNFPLSLIVFEIKNRREGGSTADALNTQAAGIAAMRIDLVKRPLDTIGHFEAVDYALLLPNTTGSSAAFVANRMLESLTATPLIKGVDRNTLELCFGVASLPADGDDLESLVLAAKTAKLKAKQGQFPIVLSRSKKRD